MPYEGPGIYKHYKGNEYEVLGLGQPEYLGVPAGSSDEFEEANLHVVYKPLETPKDVRDSPMDFWLRPLADFNEQVRVGAPEDCWYVPRFEKIID